MSYLRVPKTKNGNDDMEIPDFTENLERRLYILQCLNQDFCPYDHKNESFKKDLKALKEMGYTISNSRRENKYRLELSDGTEYLWVFDCKNRAFQYLLEQFDFLFKLAQESKRKRDITQENNRTYNNNVFHVLLHDERLISDNNEEENFEFPGPLLSNVSTYNYKCVYKYRFFYIPDNETKLRILTAPLNLPSNIYHTIIKDLTESIPLIFNPFTYKNYDNSELYKLKRFYMPSLFPNGEKERTPWKFEHKTNSGKISPKNNFTPFALVYSFENERVYVIGNDSISPKSQKYSSVRADFINWNTLETSDNYCNYEKNYIENIADSETDNNRKRFNSELMQMLYNEVIAEMFGKNVDQPELIELKIVYSEERLKELQNLTIQRQKGFDTFRNSFHQFCLKQNTDFVSDSDKALANKHIQSTLKTYGINDKPSSNDIPLYPLLTVNPEQNTIIYKDVIRGLGDFVSFIRRYGSNVTVIQGERLKKQLAHTAENVKMAYQRILSLENTTS